MVGWFGWMELLIWPNHLLPLIFVVRYLHEVASVGSLDPLCSSLCSSVTPNKDTAVHSKIKILNFSQSHIFFWNVSSYALSGIFSQVSFRFPLRKKLWELLQHQHQHQHHPTSVAAAILPLFLSVLSTLGSTRCLLFFCFPFTIKPTFQSAFL